jgi:formylmethanofuran dehydrogenase subunit A
VIILNISQGCEVSRIGKLVQVDDPVTFFEATPHEIASNKAAAAGDEE